MLYGELAKPAWLPKIPSWESAAQELGVESSAEVFGVPLEQLAQPRSEAARALHHLLRLSHEGVGLNAERLQAMWPLAFATYQELKDLGLSEEALWTNEAPWPELSSEQNANQRGLIAWAQEGSARPVEALLEGVHPATTVNSGHLVEETEWLWKHHTPVRAKHDRYGHTLETPAPLFSEGAVSPQNFSAKFAPNLHTGQLEFRLAASEPLSLYTAGIRERTHHASAQVPLPERLALATNLLISCRAMGLERGTYAAFARALFDSLDEDSQKKVSQWVEHVGVPEEGPRRIPSLMRLLYAHVVPAEYGMSPSRFMFKQARSLESPYKEQLWKMYTNQPEEPGNLIVETRDRPSFLGEKAQATPHYWFRGDLSHYYRALIALWEKRGRPERIVGYADPQGKDGPGHSMGNYTLAHGKDERGEYLQIYDVWDLHPPALAGMEASTFLPGGPIHLTKRIYLEEFR